MIQKFLLLLLLVNLSLPVIAQETEEQRRRAVSAQQELIDARQQKVDGWKQRAQIVLGMALAIGVLGAATGGLQLSDRRWVRGATITCGLLVSLISIVKTTAFENDHHTLNKAAAEAERPLGQVKTLMVMAHEIPSGDWVSLVQEINDELLKVDRIEDRLLGVQTFDAVSEVSPQPSWSLFASPAFAQESERPSWIDKLPQDDRNYYFVGQGEADSIDLSRELSTLSAQQQAIDFFSLQEGHLQNASEDYDPRSLAERITQLSQGISKHLEYQDGVWHYYSIIAIPKKSVTTAVQFYQSEQRTVIPESVSSSLMSREPAPLSNYYVRRQETYDAIFEEANQELTAEDLSQFQRARQQRRSGDSSVAAQQLEVLLTKNPDFYLGWYNLALALDDQGLLSEAVHAYEQAARLEPQEPRRDASLYNTYGFTLFRLGRYQEALDQASRALEIAPDHPKALTLEKASRAKNSQ